MVSVGHVLVQGKAKQPLMTSYNIKFMIYSVKVSVTSLFRAMPESNQ